MDFTEHKFHMQTVLNYFAENLCFVNNLWLNCFKKNHHHKNTWENASNHPSFII